MQREAPLSSPCEPVIEHEGTAQSGTWGGSDWREGKMPRREGGQTLRQVSKRERWSMPHAVSVREAFR